MYLAYVFWHWLRVGGDVAAYEDALTAFQRTLLENAPPGYRGAMVFRHDPAPWLSAPGPHYVDWYLVDGSAVLDPLNDAAVSAACSAAHDVAAGAAAGGTAGLYRLRQGAVKAAEVRCATWFCKPAGMSYEALYADLADRTQAIPSRLWSRAMTLGPTPEMCLLAPVAISLPAEFDAIAVPMEPLWPPALDAQRRDPEQESLQ
jgi:hypothetical protein